MWWFFFSFSRELYSAEIPTAGGGGGQEGFPKPVFMVKVVACLSASGMLTYKGCDYSIYRTRDSLSRLNL